MKHLQCITYAPLFLANKDKELVLQMHTLSKTIYDLFLKMLISRHF